MRIAIGADHAGFSLKPWVVQVVEASGHEAVDLGTFGPEPSVDYPDFARAVGEAILNGAAERGVLLCGSGIGSSIAANKMPGIRAGVCHDVYSAHQGVEHDDMNVLVLGARVVGQMVAEELVRAFLAAEFSHDERHQRRLEKVAAIERSLGGVRAI